MEPGTPSVRWVAERARSAPTAGAAVRWCWVVVRRRESLPAAMKCPYACVASPSGEILVERASNTGNASDICGRILLRLPRKPDEAGRKTYTMGEDGFAFRLAWKADGCTFVVLEKGLGDQTAWKFLGRMRKRWEAAYGGATLIEVTPADARPFALELSEMLADPEAASRGPNEKAPNDLSLIHI